MNQDVQNSYCDWLNQGTPMGLARAKVLKMRDCNHIGWREWDGEPCPFCGLEKLDLQHAKPIGGVTRFNADEMWEEIFRHYYAKFKREADELALRARLVNKVMKCDHAFPNLGMPNSGYCAHCGIDFSLSRRVFNGTRPHLESRRIITGIVNCLKIAVVSECLGSKANRVDRVWGFGRGTALAEVSSGD